MKILFIGDIVGKAGRLAVAETLPKWKQEHQPDFIIANAENSAHGHGATPGTLDELMTAGVEAFTFGDHLTDEHMKKLGEYPLVRLANLTGNHPGVGARTFGTALHKKILTINLLGNAFIKRPSDNFFDAIDAILKEHDSADLDAIFVDFHVEATSEATALGFYLDGRVSAIVGTHTHVPTADGRILPKGTAYQTDVGMAGTLEGVLGFHAPTSIQWLRKELGEHDEKVPLTVAEERPYVVDAVLIDTNGPHKSRSITRLTTR